MRLLKVASTAAKCRENCCGNVGFEYGFVEPAARSHVHQVDGDGIGVVITAVWTVDAAQPVERVRVTGPHEGSVLGIGEPFDAASRPLAETRVAETHDAQSQGPVERGLRVDIVTAGSHRGPVHRGHPRYSACDMETFKRYLMFQGMMFVFGIVGPIFLVLYFASQPDPSMRWAYWIGLFITTADILIALGLTASTASPKKD